MIEALLTAGLVLLVIIIVLQVILLSRKFVFDVSPVQQAFASVEKAHQRTEQAVRDEISRNREEASTTAQRSREELGNTLKGVGDTLNQQLQSLTQTNDQKLEQVRQDGINTAKNLREEVGSTLKEFNGALVASISQMATFQKTQLDVFSQRLERLTEATDLKLGTMRETIEQRLTAMQEANGQKLDQIRQESAAAAQNARNEVKQALKEFGDAMTKALDDQGSAQRTQLGNVVDQLAKLTKATEDKLDAQRSVVDVRLKQIQDESNINARQMREEMGKSLKDANDSVIKGMTGMAEAQRLQMEGFSIQLGKLTDSNQQKLDSLRAVVEEKLKHIQEDNTKQLDQMRATVDEKLQGTLEKRLGESFKQVSEHLIQVATGLGEMRVLATGVVDLKNMLSNVKLRGMWGEIQLEAMLEQVLMPEQYEKNVATKGGTERIEFAIRFPGHSDDKDEFLLLPLDAKFPIEDYQRLVDAQEMADAGAAEAAIQALEARIKGCAKDIAEKYINPPKTTDFAILYLPVEGLFAEVVRRVGLTDFIRQNYRVIIAGPTTLWSILNSLQMGFKTLAIQKKSSDVWRLLEAVKAEWSKYGEALDAVQAKLQQASKTIEKAQTRTRVIGKKLKKVQELPPDESKAILMLNDDEDEVEDDSSFGGEEQTVTEG